MSRGKVAEMSRKQESRRHTISVAQAQFQQEVLGDLVQRQSHGQSLTRLEPKGSGDLHWLPYRATSGPAGSFTQQVVLQWIWPQVLFDNLSNPIRLGKAVVWKPGKETADNVLVPANEGLGFVAPTPYDWSGKRHHSARSSDLILFNNQLVSEIWVSSKEELEFAASSRVPELFHFQIGYVS